MNPDTPTFRSALERFMYRPAAGLCVVTSYYNPCGYRTRRSNYDLFAAALRQSGIKLLTIECAFGTQPFTLPETSDVVKLRSKSVIWQKERLLNLAISWLPASYQYVAWLDCDLLFQNPDWALDTVKLLNDVPVVQTFESCNRLPRTNLRGEHDGNICPSFASITPDNLEKLPTGRFEDHGHTGYGWAARRSVLDRHGLYEYAIAGSADLYISHALFGDLDGPCMRRMMGDDRRILAHFSAWAKPFHRTVRGRIAAVPGQILHLWHGDLKYRKYLDRHRSLARFGFNPYTDLVASPGKPFEWAPELGKQRLKAMFREYFLSRHEDGKKRIAA